MTTIRDYKAKLKARGYKELGHGLYAVVLAKPKSNYVIKVYDYDEACSSFLEEIQKAYNPHFPKIYSIKEFEGQDGSMWVRVKMEKLIPFEMHNTKHPTAKTLQRSLRTAQTDNFNQIIRNIGDNLKLQKTFLYKAVRIVLALADEGYCLDMHNENIMFRKIGRKMQLVITDPLSDG